MLHLPPIIIQLLVVILIHHHLIHIQAHHMVVLHMDPHLMAPLSIQVQATVLLHMAHLQPFKVPVLTEISFR